MKCCVVEEWEVSHQLLLYGGYLEAVAQVSLSHYLEEEEEVDLFLLKMEGPLVGTAHQVGTGDALR